MGNQQGSRTPIDHETENVADSNGRASISSQVTRNYYANAPLTFHPIHGTCIRLSGDSSVATRYQSFCNGLCFSNRPVGVGERVHVKCIRTSDAWSGSVRIGFTTWDPAAFDSSLLPRYSCPDLANHAGFWVKALPEGAMTRQNDELLFYFNKIGTVFYGHDPENMTPLICGLETTRPLWAIIDVYGNTVAVSIRSSFRGKKKPIATANREGGFPPEVLRLASVDGHASTTANSRNPRPSVDISSFPVNSGEGLPPAPAPASLPPVSPSTPASASSRLANLPPLNHLSSLPVVRNLTFSTQLSGKNVSLTSDQTVAMRSFGEFCNAYVFTSRPIALGTKVAIQVVSVTSEYRGGLTFGITAADLPSVKRESLPNNSDDLLDRSEYWVVNKDVCSNPCRGDEIIFSFVSPGAIQISRNNQPPSTLMYVDGSLSLTFFFDLYGSVESIRLLGTIDPSHPTVVSLPPENNSRAPVQEQASRIAGAAAAVAAARSVASGPSPNAVRTLNAEQLLHEPLVATPRLPPPLMPVPAHPVKSSIQTPVIRPPPVPARPARVSLSQTNTAATATTNTAPISTAKLSSNESQPSIPKPLSLYPPKLLTSPKNDSSSSGFQSVTPSTTANTPSSVNTPSSAILDAFRQNAQNALGDKGSGSNEDALLSNECTVCLAQQVDCVLYSCGHLCLCYSCAQSVRKADNLCPICRDPIKDVIKVFKC